MNPFKMFDLERSKYQSRIAELNEELTLARCELQELRQAREAVLMEVMIDGDVSTLDSRIELSRTRVAVLEERIRFAGETMKDTLTGLLQGVEEQRQRAVAKKEQEYRDAIHDLNRKKLEYLADAAHIGELANEVNEINYAANECRQAAGEQPQHFWPFESQLTLTAHPHFTGFDDASWKTLAIPDWLVRAAIHEMKLPSWREDLNDGKK